MAELYLSLNQEEAENPYIFKTTLIKVFSFEEALYHCFHYWKQSIDDFTSDDFIHWVNSSLKLSIISAKLRELSRVDSLCDKLKSFLTLTDYFRQNELDALIAEVELWERRLDWEKLKEQADYLMSHEEYEKAHNTYLRALKLEKNCELLNNIAISLMKQDLFSDATTFLEQAVGLAEDKDRKKTLMYHLTECLVLGGQLESAKKTIVEINKLFGYSAELFCYQGDIEYSAGDVSRSIFYYEKAIESSNNPEFIYRLADVYVRTRQFEKALALLQTIERKDKFSFKTIADIHVLTNNVPAAVKSMEQALMKDATSVDVWTRLATYHRLNYDLNRASSAIIKALDLAPDSEKANLENARIKKAQGKTKDYQAILKKVLNGFKNKYRELD